MHVERLFHVLVVAGASSTAGLVGCGSDDTGGGTGSSTNGGASATGGASNGGSATNGGAAGSGDACEAKCHPDPASSTWTDCGGCCCWLAAGATSPLGPICGQEPCCVGRGR